MSFDTLPLMAMLKGRMGYLNQRQNLISQNVANADTPGYRPRDLKPFSFETMVKSAGAGTPLARTDPGHLIGRGGNGASSSVTTDEPSPDSEVRLDGNGVAIEEQMSKLTEARIDYEAAVGFYQQSLEMITTAAKRPGA